MRAGRTEHFVLWGTQCDEAAAAIFVTTLRAAGLRVRVVGISGRRWAGAHGLALTPDLTLGQALRLAAHTRCVIIPCAVAQLRGFLNDPRLGELFECARIAQALFVVGETSTARDDWLLVGATISCYPVGEGLISFAQRLAADLGQED